MKKAFLILAMTASSVVQAAGGRFNDSGWQPGPSSAWFVNWDKAASEAKKSGCLDGRPETRQHLRGESLDSYLQRIREILDRKPAKTGETTISPQSRAEGGVVTCGIFCYNVKIKIEEQDLLLRGNRLFQ